MNRREFGTTLVGLAAVLGSETLDAPQTADEGQVGYFRASVAKLWARDQIVGGGALASDGLRLCRRVRLVLDESDYREETARDLLSVASEAAICAGWLHREAGDPETARYLLAEGRLLAEQADDNELVIRALQQMSHLMVQSSRETGSRGYARQAVTLSQRAVDLARSELAPELHAILAARQAVAYAAVGDQHGFEAAMSRAWREMDNSSPDSVSGWLRFVNRFEVLTHDACGQWYLGDPGSAVNIFRSSLEATLLPRNKINYRALLASALSDEGDVTSAIEESLLVLPALESGEVTSSRTVAHLGNVRRAASGRPASRGFCERFDKAERLMSG